MKLNIVIDIDGVITSLDFLKAKKDKHTVLDASHDKIKQNKVKKRLIALGIHLYSKHAKVRENASKVILDLKEQGDQINILTKRLFAADEDKIGYKIKSAVEDHLTKNNIYYDNLIFTTGNKVKECLELNTDIVIEDNPFNIIALAKAGFKVICFATPYNKMIAEDMKNIYIANNWEDVYNKIELIRKKKEVNQEFTLKKV